MSSMWRIVCRPEGHNPGIDDDKNEGAMIVLLTHEEDGDEHELGRVGWIRRNAMNPSVTLDDMIERVIGAATAVITILNDERFAPGARL